MDLRFFIVSIGFGVALAMDAFSVSLANGLNEPNMPARRAALIAGVFAGFQIGMPLLGWALVHTLESNFAVVERIVPWAALALLSFLGGRMLWEGIRRRDGDDPTPAVGIKGLLLQGVATSIDALSVGLTIADLGALPALVEALVIGIVTFVICVLGILLGRIFGTKLAGRASILGGAILIAIGIEIFVKGIFL